MCQCTTRSPPHQSRLTGNPPNLQPVTVGEEERVCVFYYCRTYYKAVRVGGGGEWRTCVMRDDEPRPVWMSLLITH
jgi:hypothetical protein